MTNKPPTKKQREDYIQFLQKRVDSKNYINAVSVTEYEKTKKKLASEKLRYKLLYK